MKSESKYYFLKRSKQFLKDKSFSTSYTQQQLQSLQKQQINKQNQNRLYEVEEKSNLNLMQKKSKDLQQLNLNLIENNSLLALTGLQSNKGRQCLKIPTEMQSSNLVIFQGLTKDKKFRLISRAFEGKQLLQAIRYEREIYYKSKKGGEVNKKVKQIIPHLEPSKISSKQNGNIKAYAVNTNQGISRSYNEDRVSVILNINKNGVRSSFFAVYDGHGGSNCCDYLRDFLHESIVNHPKFPSNPKLAIQQGVKAIQQSFLALVRKNRKQNTSIDRSGSCAIIVIIVGSDCFVANIGDSRAIISHQNGKSAFNLSRDHKPSEPSEIKRILANGGKIYRTQMVKINEINSPKSEQKQLIIGPLRVYPGKLSVSRTLGDIQAKDTLFGGLPNCITLEPQIRKFRLQGKEDFIFLGCDGIFQKLQSSEVIRLIWTIIRKNDHLSIHEIGGLCVQEIIRESMINKSTDNLTGILIFLRPIGKKSMLYCNDLNYRSL